ncbi:MAG TPA: C4-dicarboxylate ABC transporter, partial [Rubrivivax sp.]|nr:C4-dicarboxylate ABC transporter [Rubrivivax sp.]
KGSIAFIVLQLIMVAALIAFPQLVTQGIQKIQGIDADKALEGMGLPDAEPAEREADAAADAASAPEAGGPRDDNDPMRALEESMKKDTGRK